MRLRVATWNMNHWACARGARERSWRFLEGVVAPDVALLQEAVPPRGRARIVTPDGGQGARRPWGALVVSRRVPISRVPSVRVRWHGGPIDLLRTLVGAAAVARVTPDETAPLVCVSVCGAVEEGFALATVHRLLSDLTPLLSSRQGRRVILGGDLAATTQTQSADRDRHRFLFDRIASLGFVDLLARTRKRRPHLARCPCGDPACAHVQTYRRARSRTPWQHDYLFATKALADRLVLCRQWDSGDPDPFSLSDHCPVVAEFDL